MELPQNLIGSLPIISDQHIEIQNASRNIFRDISLRSKCPELQRAIAMSFPWNSLKLESGNLYIISNEHILKNLRH